MIFKDFKFSHEDLLDALHYDPETGIFTWRKARGHGHGRVDAGAVAGGVGRDGYNRLKFQGQEIRSARLAWFYVHGEWPQLQIDHRNCVCTDDRIENLRLATARQNTANKRKRSNVTSKFIGVCWNKASRKWQASIKEHGRTIYLGLFSSESDAAKAYQLRAAVVHGQFARSN